MNLKLNASLPDRVYISISTLFQCSEGCHAHETYAPLCSRGGRKSGFSWRMVASLFRNSLVDGSQQVSKSYTWTRTCLSQTGAGSRYNFFRIEYQGPRNSTYLTFRGPKGMNVSRWPSDVIMQSTSILHSCARKLNCTDAG